MDEKEKIKIFLKQKISLKLDEIEKTKNNMFNFLIENKDSKKEKRIWKNYIHKININTIELLKEIEQIKMDFYPRKRILKELEFYSDSIVWSINYIKEFEDVVETFFYKKDKKVNIKFLEKEVERLEENINTILMKIKILKNIFETIKK